MKELKKVVMKAQQFDNISENLQNIETCILPDFDKNNSISGSWKIYGRPFKYIDTWYG